MQLRHNLFQSSHLGFTITTTIIMVVVIIIIIINVWMKLEIDCDLSFVHLATSWQACQKPKPEKK